MLRKHISGIHKQINPDASIEEQIGKIPEL